MSRRPPAGDPRIVVAYARVSTDEQHLGAEAQRASIVVWAAAHGAAVCAFHQDTGVSGASEIEARPGLLAALRDLTELGAGLLVVARRDRIARDVVVAATLEQAVARAGAAVVSADGAGNGSGPADAFMRTVIDGAAAYERALIRARTRAALATKRARGERIGTLPYGYRLAGDGIHLTEDECEQAILHVVRSLRRNGSTLRAIAAELALRRLHSRAGKPFGLARVHAMTLEIS